MHSIRKCSRVVTGSDDTHICLWRVPEEGITTSLLVGDALAGTAANTTQQCYLRACADVCTFKHAIHFQV
jgi:hypothetical protein